MACQKHDPNSAITQNWIKIHKSVIKPLFVTKFFCLFYGGQSSMYITLHCDQVWEKPTISAQLLYK